MITLALTLICGISIALSLARGRLATTEKYAQTAKLLGAAHPFVLIFVVAAIVFVRWPVVATSPGFVFYLCLPIIGGMLYGFSQWRRQHPGAISGAILSTLGALFGAMVGRRSRSRRNQRAKASADVPPGRPYLRAILPSWVRLSLAEDAKPWVIAHQILVLCGALVALNLPAGVAFPGAQFLVPLVLVAPSYLRWRSKDAAAYGQILEGNQLLFDTKVIKTQQKIYEKVWLERGELKSTLHIDEPITGVPTAQLTATVGKFSDHMNAVRTRVVRNNGSNGIAIEFYHIEPLDEPVVITEPLPLEPKKMKITCAVNSLGEAVTLTLGDASGMVIGGIPGSGKTGGATSFLLSLALSPYVDMSIIDGKGGEDWVNYRGVISHFIKGDTDLVPIYDYIEKFSAQMYDRLNNLKAKLGTSNFWNATPEERLAAGVPLKLLVIDECQGVFQPRKLKVERENGMTDMDMISEITRKVEDLIKRGRSAGVFVILMTQKPTADAMPTAIRDNAGLRIAFHVQTQASEQAILGVTPKDVPGMPSATTIPADRKGGAVLATDTGEYEMVRFYFMPEHEQERVLQAAVHAHGQPVEPARSATFTVEDAQAFYEQEEADEMPFEAPVEPPAAEEAPPSDSTPSAPVASASFMQGGDEQVPLPFDAGPVEPEPAIRPPRQDAPAPAGPPAGSTVPDKNPFDWEPEIQVVRRNEVWGGVGQGDVPRDSYLSTARAGTPAAAPASKEVVEPAPKPPDAQEVPGESAEPESSGGFF